MGKYFFREIGITKDLIILLSIFYSCKKTHNLTDPLVDNGSILSIACIETETIQEKLIISAIKLRIIDDLLKENNKPHILPYSIVGEITEESAHKGLSFRKACNKIIHASKFTPNILINDRLTSGKEYTVPTVYLEGYRGSKLWKATLDVNSFVCNGLSYAKHYDES